MNRIKVTTPAQVKQLNPLFWLFLILLTLPGTGRAAASGIDPNSTNFFAVTSYNPSRLESVYFNLVDNSDPAPATVGVVTPADGTPVSSIVSINVGAPQGVAVAKVQLFVNGAQIAETATSPYAFSWDTSALDGAYTVSVQAFDAAGNAVVSDNVAVTLGDLSAPLTILDAQAALQIASGTVAPTADQLMRLDVAPYIDGKSLPNGKIDTGDVVVILSKLVGKL